MNLPRRRFKREMTLLDLRHLGAKSRTRLDESWRVRFGYGVTRRYHDERVTLTRPC